MSENICDCDTVIKVGTLFLNAGNWPQLSFKPKTQQALKRPVKISAGISKKTPNDVLVVKLENFVWEGLKIQGSKL